MPDNPEETDQVAENAVVHPPPVPLAADSPPAVPAQTKQVVADKLSAIKTFAFGTGPLPARTEKNLCVVIHLIGCFFWFVPPLILWLWKRDDSAAIDAHGKEAINFQLTFFVLTLTLAFVSCGALAIPAYLSSIIFAAIAAAKAGQGTLYRYPIAVRIIK